jgi:hypothetical protein
MRWTRRGCTAVLCVPILAAATVTGAGVPAAAAAGAASCDPVWAANARWDFDRNCTLDTVAGAPGYDAGGRRDAGAIQITLDVSPPGSPRSRLVTAGSLGFADQAGARFGTSVQIVDVDLDQFIDVAVGAPGATVDGVARAGAVYLIYGGPRGLGTGKTTEVITEKSLGLPTAAAGFGSAMARLIIMDDSELGFRLPLAVGSPLATVAGKGQAGRVDVFEVRPGWSRLESVVTQAGRAVEAGDRFGQVLLARGRELFVGVPLEDVGSRVDAGAVSVWHDGAVSTYTQNSPGMGGTAEAGDRFGASLTSASWPDSRGNLQNALLVGAPLEDVGRRVDAGAVNVLARDFWEGGSPPPLQGSPFVITASSRGFVGTTEPGDRLGSALQIRCADSATGDTTCQLAIGVPGEDVGTVRDAGSVCLVHLARVATPNDVPARCVHQRSASVPGTAEPRDHFGQTLAVVNEPFDESGRSSTLIVGVPGEDVGSSRDVGIMQTVYPYGTLPPAARQQGAGFATSLLQP